MIPPSQALRELQVAIGRKLTDEKVTWDELYSAIRDAVNSTMEWEHSDYMGEDE